MRTFGIFVIGLWFVAQPVFAKTGEASVTGGVHDISGARIVRAEAELQTARGGKRVTKTDESGMYRFFDLAPGEYTLTLRSPGFKWLVLKFGATEGEEKVLPPLELAVAQLGGCDGHLGFDYIRLLPADSQVGNMGGSVTLDDGSMMAHTRQGPRKRGPGDNLHATLSGMPSSRRFRSKPAAEEATCHL